MPNRFSFLYWIRWRKNVQNHTRVLINCTFFRCTKISCEFYGSPNRSVQSEPFSSCYFGKWTFNGTCSSECIEIYNEKLWNGRGRNSIHRLMRYSLGDEVPRNCSIMCDGERKQLPALSVHNFAFMVWHEQAQESDQATRHYGEIMTKSSNKERRAQSVRTTTFLRK